MLNDERSLMMGRILIIEDEIFTRKGLRRIIKEIDENASIIETGSVLEAEKIITTLSIDLFIIDIQLEDGNGLELAKKIRAYKKYKLTHIVFLTAVPTYAIMAYSETHCYSYIIKPFDEKYLFEQLATLINYGYRSVEASMDKLELNLRNCIYVVDIKDIIYIEAQSQRLYITTIKERIEVPKTTLKSLNTYLTKAFVQCHKAFVINKDMVQSINRSERYVILNHCKEKIPVGRKYYSILRGELL